MNSILKNIIILLIKDKSDKNKSDRENKIKKYLSNYQENL